MNAAKFKDRTRLTRSPPQPERRSSGASLKGSNLFVSDVEVTVGSRVEISMTVSNGANLVCNDDPDCCGPRCGDILGTCSLLNGYQYFPFVVLNGERWKDDPRCIDTTEIGTADITHNFSIPKPLLDGTYSLKFGIKGNNSGDIASGKTEVVIGNPDGPGGIGGGDGGGGSTGCISDSDCAEGQVCFDSECVEDNRVGGGGGNGGNGGNGGGDTGGSGGGVSPLLIILAVVVIGLSVALVST